ncbi:MAG: zinc ABC transporter substrate-binding protein [Clostridia bacterium]|nr:zinc ABC transporter substrate-binding protein [Clostridia bacterium]
MKIKLFALIMCVICLFSAVSCEKSEEKDGLNIVCTIFPQYDFTRNIAGDDANISLLVPPGKEAHSYEATVADMAKLRRADLIIYVGGDIDGWVLSALEGTEIPTVCMLDAVTLISGSCDADVHDGHDHAEGADLHVWTSPKNAILISEAIKDALVKIDAENTAIYTENCAEYVNKLSALDRKFEAAAANARNKMIVFAEKFPFRYLCEHYGIEHYAAFDGCSTQSEPSLTVLSSLANIIRENGLNAVLTVEFSSATVADWLARETGTQVLALHSCHSLTQEEFKRGETYLSLMEKNLEALTEAMK